MKKSVMQEVLDRRARTAEGARVLMALIEKAGVTWDPEEEPMAERARAERLALPFADGREGWGIVRDVKEGWKFMSREEAEIAADLYNRRHTFERIAQEMTALHDRFLHKSVVRFADEAALLENWIAHLRSPIQ